MDVVVVSWKWKEADSGCYQPLVVGHHLQWEGRVVVVLGYQTTDRRCDGKLHPRVRDSLTYANSGLDKPFDWASNRLKCQEAPACCRGGTSIAQPSVASGLASYHVRPLILKRNSSCWCAVVMLMHADFWLMDCSKVESQNANASNNYS